MSICGIHLRNPATHIPLLYTCQFAIYNARHMSICDIHSRIERHTSICCTHFNLPHTMRDTWQIAVYNREMSDTHIICRIHFNLPYTMRDICQFAVYFQKWATHINLPYTMRDTCQFVVYIWEMSNTHVNLPHTHQFAVYNARHMSNCRLHFRNERHTYNLPYIFQFAIYNARHMSICGIHLRNERHTSICRIHINLPYTMRDTWQIAVYIWEMSDTHVNLPYTCQFAVYNARHMSICGIHWRNERHISICRIHINLPYTMRDTCQFAVYIWEMSNTHVNLPYTCQFAVYNARHMTNCRLQLRNERHTYNLPYTFQFAVYNAGHMSICGIHFRNELHISICRIHINLPYTMRDTCQFVVYIWEMRNTHVNLPYTFQFALYNVRHMTNLPFTFEKWATHI